MSRRPAQGRAPRPVNTADLRFGYLIHDVSRLRRTVFDRWLSPSGITRSQWWVLAFLSREDGMPQTHLADQLDVGKVALGALIDRLEASGFVRRVASTTDRRVKLVYLTDDGRAILRTVRSNSRDFNRRILDGISPEEVANAVATLTVIKQNMLNGVDHGPAREAALLDDPED